MVPRRVAQCWFPQPPTSLRYSVWCFVATNTTVWSWGRTTVRSRWSSTAALVSSRTRKKEVCGERGQGGLTGSRLQAPEGARVEPHLKLLVEFGVHIEPDEHRLREACGWHREGVGGGWWVGTGGRAPRPLSSGGPSTTTTPAHSPARANSTSSLGSVAENRTVWWPPGRRPMISCSCSAKPISKSLGDRGQGLGEGLPFQRVPNLSPLPRTRSLPCALVCAPYDSLPHSLAHIFSA